MKKGKIAIIVLLIILLILFTFLGVTIKKVKIIEEIAQKAPEYAKAVNYYEKVENVTQGIITEYFNNGDREKLVLTRFEGGKATKIEYYNNGKMINSYTTEPDGTMKAKYDIEFSITKPHNIGKLFDDKTFEDKLKIALTHSIKNAELDGKECYYFKPILPRDCYINMHLYELNDLYIEKETGLELQRQNGNNGRDGEPIILKYSYDFGNVKVEEFTEPEDVVIEIVEGSVTTTSADIVIKSDNPRRKTGWGSYFEMQVKNDNKWTDVEAREDIIWSDMGSLDDENKLEENISWPYLYGELPNGTYRIVKHCDGIDFYSEEFIIDEKTPQGELPIEPEEEDSDKIMKYDRETGETTEVDMDAIRQNSVNSTESKTRELLEELMKN